MAGVLRVGMVVVVVAGQGRGRASLRLRSIDRLRLGIPSSAQGDPCPCLWFVPGYLCGAALTLTVGPRRDCGRGGLSEGLRLAINSPGRDACPVFRSRALAHSHSTRSLRRGRETT